MSNNRIRVQAIIIRGNKTLFGYGKVNNEMRHFFIGGGLDKNESLEEGIIREIKEETNVEGYITFRFNRELKENHYTFLVDINNQETILGLDPEYEERILPFEEKTLQKLIWVSLDDIDEFTKIDKEYFKVLIEECDIRDYKPEWIEKIRKIAND